jgi:hypothetical protein
LAAKHLFSFFLQLGCDHFLVTLQSRRQHTFA